MALAILCEIGEGPAASSAPSPTADQMVADAWLALPDDQRAQIEQLRAIYMASQGGGGG